MYSIYQIANNDNLESIANRFNTTVDNIKKLNGINGNVMLRPGGFLIVPMQQNSELKTYIVKKGDNMYSIAKDNEADYKMLLELNGLDENDYIYPEQEIIIPKENTKLYKVQEGDSINSIEEKTGVNINKIKTPNGKIYLEKDQIIMY